MTVSVNESFLAVYDELRVVRYSKEDEIYNT
jgi:hypothetical protein